MSGLTAAGKVAKCSSGGHEKVAVKDRMKKSRDGAAETKAVAMSKLKIVVVLTETCVELERMLPADVVSWATANSTDVFS